MKTIFTILLTVGMLQFATAMPGKSEVPATALTKQVAKEIGLNKDEFARIEELNQELTRELRIAAIVYKNHPILREAKMQQAVSAYNTQLKQALTTEQFQAFQNLN